MPLSTTYDNKVLDWLLSGQLPTLPTSVDIGLSGANPAKDGSGITEASGYTTLSSATGTTAITSLAVVALKTAVTSGDSIIVATPTATQTFTANANAIVGATSISITSATPSVNFPVGSTVVDSTVQNYQRVLSVPLTLTEFPAASAGSKSNGIVVSFNTVGAGGWGNVSYWFAMEHGTNNLVCYDSLVGAPITIVAGSSPDFPVGSLILVAN